MMKIINFVPLFGVLLIVFWILHLTGVFPEALVTQAFSMGLPSGRYWSPTWGELFIILSILVLFVELFKSTRTNDTTIIDHVLSTFVLVAYLVIWLTEPWVMASGKYGGDSTFLILTLMSFLDVIAGFTITISTARRDLAIGG